MRSPGAIRWFSATGELLIGPVGYEGPTGAMAMNASGTTVAVVESVGIAITRLVGTEVASDDRTMTDEVRCGPVVDPAGSWVAFGFRSEVRLARRVDADWTFDDPVPDIQDPVDLAVSTSGLLAVRAGDGRVCLLDPGPDTAPEWFGDAPSGRLVGSAQEFVAVGEREVTALTRAGSWPLPGRFGGLAASCDAGAVLIVRDAPIELRVASGDRFVLEPLPRPRLGARVEATGTTFSVAAPDAEEVHLCLFDDQGGERRYAMNANADGTWSRTVEGIGTGQRYGYRADGPFNVNDGLWFNPAKLLVDPWALAVTGELLESDALAPIDSVGRPQQLDSAPYVPRSVVCEPPPPLEGDRLNIPLEESVLYEVHVKGATMLHPDVSPALRGTYRGLAEPPFVDHLRRLGVTTVVLLPVQQFVHGRDVLRRGLRNYWGFDLLAPFAPHEEYAARRDGTAQVAEMRAMVDALHEAGLEVLVTVSASHTAEGGQFGPTLSYRGLDDRRYYRHPPGEPGNQYEDLTGTGNTLDARQSIVQHLILESLRYWVRHLAVDGFLFSMATVLGRDVDDFDDSAPLLELIRQDDVLAGRKLIAEPWDLGRGGYVEGRFPRRFSQVNASFQDVVRDLWRGAPVGGSLPSRLAGSHDLFGTGLTSVNVVTTHDGLTLRDLVAYNDRHNEANGEDNRDGASDNRSWNCGVEGPTDDPLVVELRARQVRNLLTTLFVSDGVPMLCGGDEIGRTQLGNNHAYCQDNELTWFDWPSVDLDLFEFTRQLIELRRSRPALRPAPDVMWTNATGSPIDWRRDRTAMALLDGGNLLIALNWDAEPAVISPVLEHPLRAWRLLIDSSSSISDNLIQAVSLPGRSAVVLESIDVPAEQLDEDEADAPAESDDGEFVASVAIGGSAELVVSGWGDGAVRVWRSSGSIDVIGVWKGPIRAVAIGDHAGRVVVVIGEDDGTVWIHDATTGRAVAARGHTSFVRSVAVGDGVAVSGGADGTVRLWELEKGDPIGSPLRHRGQVDAVTIGRLGGSEVVVSGGEDDLVHVWNLERRRRRREQTFAGHSGWVHSVAIARLGEDEVFASAAYDGTVRIWDPHSDKPRNVIGVGDAGVLTMTIGMAGGRLVVVTGDNDGVVWTIDPWSGETLLQLPGQSRHVNSVAIGRLSRRDVIVSGGRDGTVRVWDAVSGEPIGGPLTARRDEPR